MRQLCKYLIALSLLLTVSFTYTMLDTSNITKCGGCCSSCCNPCGCGTCCSPCGGCCGSCGGGCGSCCGPCSGDCCCNDSCCNACACGYPFFAYRSQGINTARNMAGCWRDFIYQNDMDTKYGVYSLTLEYTRSFAPRDINRFLFGQDVIQCQTLYIQGTHVPDRDHRAWLADYFGLPDDFDGRVKFCPTIENVILDFNAYLGLDDVTEGLYFRLFAPFVWTKWCLNMREYVINRGTNELRPGFRTAGTYDATGTYITSGIPRDDLPENFTQAMTGCETWGDMKEPIKFGRITNNKMTLVGLADLHAILGWNFAMDEDYHVGINARLVIPTSRRPCCMYLFEPQIGDRKHWQIGLGLSGSWIFWRKDDAEDHHYGVYIDANLTHLFKRCQCRSFDFCCKPNSRYMLLAQMGDNEDNIGGGDLRLTTSADYQYAKKLIPAINYTTLCVDVKVAAQFDMVIKFGYVNGNFSYDWGYNLWIRSREKFCYNNCCSGCCDTCCGGCCGSCNSCCGPCGGCCTSNCGCGSCGCGSCCGSCGNCCTSNCGCGSCGCGCCGGCCNDVCCGCGPTRSCGNYVIKGDAAMYGYQIPIEGDQHADIPVALSASQCEADIHSGANIKLDVHDEMIASKAIDNAQLSWIGTSSLNAWQDPSVTPIPTTIQRYTSIQPKLISTCDLNMLNSPLGLSNKFFYHLNYAWKDREDNLIPFFGAGFELEFGSTDIIRFGVTQWGAWLKGGFYWE